MGLLPALRSLLFVPGSRQDFLAKASARGADAIVLDLEDAVAPAARNVARTRVAAELVRPGPLRFVRINHPAAGELDEDLAVLGRHDQQAIMVPKVARVEDVAEVDARLSAFERHMGLIQHTISLLVVIETSLGLRSLFDILRSKPRIRGAALASAEEGDFMLDIGGRWTPTGEALTYARGKFVCDARAAGVSLVLDGAFMNLRDTQALETECHIARNHGFSGKVAVHPRQVSTINQVFSPSPPEIERARQLMQALAESQAQGRGAVEFRGMMVDSANLKWAQRTLRLAEQLAGTPPGGGSPGT